ncbi:MAG TPA: hypothetical protein VGY66_19505 [Gemmataceae bacterium]|jgi:hypothetical protein|nr:hypothetical protein [Gemmataceae bacterium]
MSDSKHPLWNLLEAWLPVFLGFLPLVACGAVLFLKSMQTTEVIWMLAVLTAAALVFTGLLCWRGVRLKQAHNELLKEMLHRGLSAAEIERVTQPAVPPAPPLTDDEMIKELAQALAVHAVAEPVLEEILAIFAAAPADQRRMIYGIVPVLVGFREEAEILRAVKAVCGANLPPDARENLTASEAIQSIAR